MNWYYAHNGQQLGPISDMEFTTLYREGTLTATSLVWKEGMEKWEPLQVARPDLIETSVSPIVGGMAVDEQNKDLLVQQLREGTSLNQSTTIPGTGLRYAGFWIRFAARLIDLVILYALVFVVFLVLGFGFAGMGASGMDESTAMTTMMVMQLALSLGMWIVFGMYHSIMVAKWGGSLGKLAVGLRVVSEDGQPLTTARAYGRGFADLISLLVCSLPYLMVAFDEPQKRALHDHICATRVVYKA